MITEEDLAQQFTTIITLSFPQVGALLNQCYVKGVKYPMKSCVHWLPSINIYCPDKIIADVRAQRYVLTEVAECVGLVEVVCLNATHLLRDPILNLYQADKRLWLELNWIATQKDQG